jgi:hypothetical protein
VQASAGASSFRRRDTLEQCRKEARAQVQRLAAKREQPDPGGVSARQQSARERAARERLTRVERALAHLPQLQATKEEQRRRSVQATREHVGAARASTTDPEARVMKMPDGGFRPAYNVHFATDGAHGVIVGVAVSNAGTDAGQTAPMVEQIARRTGGRPQDYLVDGGYATRDDVTGLEERGITVYAPVRAPRNKPDEERYQARWGDSPQVAGWRARMASDAAKAVYRQRGAIAEWTNAQARRHGLGQFNVRGVVNATSVALLLAIAHNGLRWLALRT